MTAKKVEDIKLIMDSLLKESYDNTVLSNYPRCVKMPFNDDIYYGER